MIELFSLFKLSFVLCCVAGVLLPIQGSHLVSRKESLQILALAQAGLVGSLIGKIIWFEQQGVSLLFSLIIFILVKTIFILNKKTSEAFYIVTYLGLLALGQSMITLFPSLDSHMALGLFGDVVSLSEVNTAALIAVFMNILVLQMYFSKKIERISIEKSILGNEKIYLFEELLYALTFIFSLYGLGLLFTVGFYIIPSVLGGKVFKSFSGSLLFLGIIGAISASSGLAASIYFSKLSTVPSQVMILLLLLFLGKLVSKRNEKVRSDLKREEIKCNEVTS